MEISLQLCKFIAYEVLLLFRTSLSIKFIKQNDALGLNIIKFPEYMGFITLVHL